MIVIRFCLYSCCLPYAILILIAPHDAHQHRTIQICDNNDCDDDDNDDNYEYYDGDGDRDPDGDDVVFDDGGGVDNGDDAETVVAMAVLKVMAVVVVKIVVPMKLLDMIR